MNDRRQINRSNIDSSVHVRSKYYQWYVTRMTNISEMGIAIYSPTTLPAGHKVNLHISLKGAQEDQRIHCTATVMHCHNRNGSYLIGFRFEDLTDTHKKMIRDFTPTDSQQQSTPTSRQSIVRQQNAA